MITRTQQEIDDVMRKTDEQMVGGSKWPGMSFEEGVRAAIEWITGQTDDNPMEDE